MVFRWFRSLLFIVCELVFGWLPAWAGKSRRKIKMMMEVFAVCFHQTAPQPHLGKFLAHVAGALWTMNRSLPEAEVRHSRGELRLLEPMGTNHRPVQTENCCFASHAQNHERRPPHHFGPTLPSQQHEHQWPVLLVHQS